MNRMLSPHIPTLTTRPKSKQRINHFSSKLSTTVAQWLRAASRFPSRSFGNALLFPPPSGWPTCLQTAAYSPLRSTGAPVSRPCSQIRGARPSQAAGHLRDYCSRSADSRFEFLSSPRGSLSDRRPLDMLVDKTDFNRLRSVAAAWAAEFSRTTVRLYEGTHEFEPGDVAPLYTASVDVDPSGALWDRASRALHTLEYERPLRQYPETDNITLFVERQTAGYSEPIREACV